MTITCPVPGRQEFYVAFGENHGALPDPFEFQVSCKPADRMVNYPASVIYWRSIRFPLLG